MNLPRQVLFEADVDEFVGAKLDPVSQKAGELVQKMTKLLEMHAPKPREKRPPRNSSCSSCLKKVAPLLAHGTPSHPHARRVAHKVLMEGRMYQYMIFAFRMEFAFHAVNTRHQMIATVITRVVSS